MQPPTAFESRLVAARALAPHVRELVLERTDGAPFVFEPGQWVNLVLPVAEGEIKRAYSIASPPAESPRYEIAVTRVAGGPGSELLHALSEGATLRTIGPHGLFTRSPAAEAPALFVATGTGVTPLRSMIRAAVRAGSRASMWLLFGARHEADILYRHEFEELARTRSNVRFFVTLSQPGPEWTGRRGYVQRHVPELYERLARETAPARPEVYVCGLERMVKAVRELARGELGVDRRHVHTERYD